MRSLPTSFYIPTFSHKIHHSYLRIRKDSHFPCFYPTAVSPESNLWEYGLPSAFKFSSKCNQHSQRKAQHTVLYQRLGSCHRALLNMLERTMKIILFYLVLEALSFYNWPSPEKHQYISILNSVHFNTVNFLYILILSRHLFPYNRFHNNIFPLPIRSLQS